MRYHVIWTTYGSWLPGESRGFRTRHHRKHVEGDYKNPPAPGTYEGLLRYSKAALKKPPVVIGPQLRRIAGEACLERFGQEEANVARISVGGQHTHVAFEWRSSDVKPLIGRVKKVASHRLREHLPGRLWARGCKIVRVRGEAHWKNVLNYIRDHGDKAWVWIRECDAPP